ncbi:hypothetical protein ANCDUO_16138 [Ancylostoma duodenale]|uniref:Fzo/mitofusin HR2 domain-containing protein n=1 Tax=Ancylostoma duodenale TaxID=51022 RepID=A0A0C2G9U8_9BILA|nr:hypothetical protein ANCDUO_16138 [Ancylostoma duodenale]
MQKAVEENAMMTQMVLTSASYLANGSIGLLVVGGIVYRAVGWRWCGSALLPAILILRSRQLKPPQGRGFW